eukprot:TRINITY_DN3695_c0_g1_i1.p1 TRINITY_DN3695_c0_g1~~TRINITY_DN3695_c0_g1_i1.p1  ORF type:complete len:140 (+),score=8.62 TRINITY_DN3695_c0_g1_i1:112-531(+)
MIHLSSVFASFLFSLSHFALYVFLFFLLFVYVLFFSSRLVFSSLFAQLKNKKKAYFVFTMSPPGDDFDFHKPSKKPNLCNTLYAILGDRTLRLASTSLPQPAKGFPRISFAETYIHTNKATNTITTAQRRLFFVSRNTH